LKSNLEVEAALAVLEDHGWVSSSDFSETVGRPTTRFSVNPRIYGRAA
jgi:predicted ArsR family transcriptional regulator